MLVLNGNVVQNIGLYMPSPYIRRVSVTDTGLDIHLSIFLLNSDGSFDPESAINALGDKLKFYIYLTVRPSRINKVISGEASVLNYLQDQEVQTEFQESPIDFGDGYIALDNIFQSSIDEEGNTKYTYLTDTENSTDTGIPVWEFRITKSIDAIDSDDLMSRETIGGLWQSYASELKNNYYLLDSDSQDSIATEGSDSEWPNGIENAPDYYIWKNWDAGIYVGAFSTAVDLQIQEQVSVVLNNNALAATRISAVSYETVTNNVDYTSGADWQSPLLNMSIISQKQTEFLRTDGSIYENVPLKSTTQQYYIPDKISREIILDSFSSLIRSPSTDYSLNNITNQISTVLDTYRDSTELIPQLNTLKNMFPSKSSTNKVGKLYRDFRKLLYSINSTLKESTPVSKRVIRNLKILDERTREAEEYAQPTSAVDLATLESSGFEYIYPNWLQSIEYDDITEMYTGYGFFMFDYQKALFTTSAISQVYDMEKLINLFGIDFTYASFNVTEARIFRCENLPCESLTDNWVQILTYMKDKDDSPSYPRTDETRALNSSGDVNNLIFPYTSEVLGPSGESSKYGFGVTSQLPMLVVRPYSVTTGEIATTQPSSDYRLMLFEYQDFFKNLPAEEARYYGAHITIRDSTRQTAAQIDKMLTDRLSDLSDYLEAANSLCSANTSTDEFNSFFIETVMGIYIDSPETAPWNVAPVVYNLFKDLIYDSYGGDKELIMEESLIIIDKINPVTGTLTGIQSFYEKMETMYDIISGTIKDILDSYSREQEITYTLPVGSGTPWPTAWTTAEFFCESDSDCASGEKCWTNQECVSKDYCTLDSQCEDLYGSDYECDSGINKCVATESEDKETSGADFGESEEGEKEDDSFDGDTSGLGGTEGETSSY